jgi:hypothetical protein
MKALEPVRPSLYKARRWLSRLAPCVKGLCGEACAALIDLVFHWTEAYKALRASKA